MPAGIIKILPCRIVLLVWLLSRWLLWQKVLAIVYMERVHQIYALKYISSLYSSHKKCFCCIDSHKSWHFLTFSGSNVTNTSYMTERYSRSKLTHASNYMFKINNRNIRTKCEICSKLTIKTPKRRHWHHSRVFIVNFEHISHLVLVLLLLTLSR